MPVLVSIQLFAHLEAYGLHPLQSFTYLDGLRQAVQVLLLDPSIQLLSGVLACQAMRHILSRLERASSSMSSRLGFAPSSFVSDRSRALSHRST